MMCGKSANICKLLVYDKWIVETQPLAWGPARLQSTSISGCCSPDPDFTPIDHNWCIAMTTKCIHCSWGTCFSHSISSSFHIASAIVTFGMPSCKTNTCRRFPPAPVITASTAPSWKNPSFINPALIFKKYPLISIMPGSRERAELVGKSRPKQFWRLSSYTLLFRQKLAASFLDVDLSGPQVVAGKREKNV